MITTKFSIDLGKQKIAAVEVRIYKRRSSMQRAIGPTGRDMLAACATCGRNFVLYFNDEDITPGIAAHEALHAASRIITEDNEEAMANVAEIIVNSIYEGDTDADSGD